MDPAPVGWPLVDDDDPRPPGRADPPAAGAHVDGINWTYQERGAASRRLPVRSARTGTSTPEEQSAGPAVSVLADRLAAALVHHEPGWRLPRHSALARRYNVSAAEIDAAVEELVSRHLVRRLADGQLYRASPAEYVLRLEGVPALVSYVDAMGGEFTCRSRQVSWRLPPEDVSWALKLPPEQQVCVIRFLWTAGGEPAALCTTYVPGDLAVRPDVGAAAGLPAVPGLLQLASVTDGLDMGGQQLTGAPMALHIELQAPPPSVARSLRLTAGQPATMVTVRFDDTETARPVALTVAVLRPDMFRVVVESPQPPLPHGNDAKISGSWTHAVEDWEP